MKKTTLIIIALVLTTSFSMLGGPIVIPGTANIFAAGFGSTPGSEGGTLPPSITGFTTPIFGSTSFTINSISGSVSCGVGCPAGSGAEGFAVVQPVNGATNISAPGNGLSGIQFTGRDFFLVGVFLDNNAPSIAPGTLVYSFDGVTNAADGSPTFQPGLSQVFYIGDGRQGFNNGAGSLQTFFAPVGATRLFVGFEDATAFQGTPGMFSDNTGSLTVDFNFPTSVPEPGSVLLVGLGLVGLAVSRKRMA